MKIMRYNKDTRPIEKRKKQKTMTVLRKNNKQIHSLVLGDTYPSLDAHKFTNHYLVYFSLAGKTDSRIVYQIISPQQCDHALLPLGCCLSTGGIVHSDEVIHIGGTSL
jgi:hypothetical protein